MDTQARAALKILRRVSALGHDPAPLVQRFTLADVLSSSESRIPFTTLATLFEAAAELASDPDFGLHLSQQTNLGEFDVLGYAAANSRDIADALQRATRCYRLWSAAGSLELTAPATVVYRAPVYRQDAEFTLALVLGAIRQLTGVAVVPVAVDFRHPPPPSTTAHERLFGVPPRFGQPETRLSLTPATLSLPVLAADPLLLELLDRHAEHQLAGLPDASPSLVSRVAAILRAELPGGDPGLQNIARQLGLSPRSLQRRLAEAGCSLASLLDHQRQELAQHHLRQQPELALAEVAWLLGFADASNFIRAFRRWTGQTPAEWRR